MIDDYTCLSTTARPSPPQAAHDFPQADGGLYAEELMGHEGFTGPSSLLYHVHQPTTVKSVRTLGELEWSGDPDQALQASALPDAPLGGGGSPTLDRMPLLFNSRRRDVVRRSRIGRTRSSIATRRATSWCTSRRAGRARDAARRDLPFKSGDYLVIHRGILHRYRFGTGADQVPGHREPRPRPLAEALSQRVRPAEGARPTPSATSGGRRR